jgi:hypothetical protein
MDSDDGHRSNEGGQLSDDHHQWQLSQTSFCGLRISFAVHIRCLKGKHDYILQGQPADASLDD